MEKRIHLYVSRKNWLTWLMVLCMAASAVTRICFPGLKGAGESYNVRSHILLPMAATTLYALIALLDGQEHFYRTAIPVWLAALYCGLWLKDTLNSRLLIVLFWIALIFFASSYTDIVSGHRGHTILFLFPVGYCPLAF